MYNQYGYIHVINWFEMSPLSIILHHRPISKKQFTGIGVATCFCLHSQWIQPASAFIPFHLTMTNMLSTFNLTTCEFSGRHLMVPASALITVHYHIWLITTHKLLDMGRYLIRHGEHRIIWKTCSLSESTYIRKYFPFKFQFCPHMYENSTDSIKVDSARDSTQGYQQMQTT